jgi:hypothetical protein
MIDAGHLKDDDLLECYLAARAGEALDPQAADHLSECRDCVTGYDRFVAFMDGMRQGAEAEADAVFPAEFLRAQQQQISRRLEQAHRSARVITFPGRDASGLSRSTTRLTAPWVAAAAAAGLLIGVAVGGYIGPEPILRGSARSQSQSGQSQMGSAMAVQPAASPAVRVSTTQAESPDDDEFLMELELALSRPHTLELQPFDAMTPHVRDIDSRVR